MKNLDGIHHISAITSDATRNLLFYEGVMGLRLVKKTVNQDNPSVYHLFYADEDGSPGADLTFFEYPGAKPGRPGAGMVHRIVHRVASDEALDFWAGRLGAEGIPSERDQAGLRFADPEGLAHELIADPTDDAPLVAVHPEVPAELALRGFEGVRAYSANPAGSGQMLEQLMGARRVGDEDRFELRGGRRGGWIAFDPAPAERGRQSAGVVHHVAWGTYDADLYELATEEPGFLVDGLPVQELGTKVILPPFLESRREQIEQVLTPLPDPRADWATVAS
jgi:glyoxalase family protein